MENLLNDSPSSSQSDSSLYPKLFKIFSLLFCLSVVISGGALGEKSRIEKGGYTRNIVCGECHSDIFNMWKNSLHAQAFEDPIFQAAYMEAYIRTGGQVKKLCLRCHAPTSSLTQDFDAKTPLTKEGVTCDFCHSVKGIHQGGATVPPFIIEPGERKWGPVDDSTLCLPFHKAGYSDLHTRSEFCSGCHEYTNPNGVPILSTYSEWKAGPYPSKEIHCQNCHMPLVEGEVVVRQVRKGKERTINLHNLQGGHSLAQVKKAAEVEITRVQRSEDRLVVTAAVINSGSGHKIPTGIPTRRLILTVEVKLPRGEVLREERVYRKVLHNGEGNEILRDSEIFTLPVRIASDNRIAPGERREEVFTFLVPRRSDAVVSARLDYLYRPLLLQESDMIIEMNRKERVVPRE